MIKDAYTDHIIEISALIASFCFWNTLKSSKLKSIPFFLLFIVIVELAGTYLVKVKHAGNIGLYNLSLPVEYIFYLYLFRQHGHPLLRAYTLFGGLLYLAACVIWHFASDEVKVNGYILLYGQVLTIGASCIYIYQLFENPDSAIALWKHYFFWITAALLLFNLGEISYTILSPVLDRNHWDDKRAYFKLINGNLLLLLYTTYVVSFFLLKKFGTDDT